MSIKKSLIVGFGTTILVSLAIIIASLMMMNSQKGAWVFAIYGSRRAQMMSPYFPFLTSPATFPSTRVMTRLRIILTYRSGVQFTR